MDQKLFHVGLKHGERRFFVERDVLYGAVPDDDEREAGLVLMSLKHQLLVATPERPAPLLHTAVIGRSAGELSLEQIVSFR